MNNLAHKKNKLEQAAALSTPSHASTSVVMLSPMSSFDEGKDCDDLSFTNAESPVSLNPGKNRVLLRTRAGAETGTYILEQLAVICLGQKLELVSPLIR